MLPSSPLPRLRPLLPGGSHFCLIFALAKAAPGEVLRTPATAQQVLKCPSPRLRTCSCPHRTPQEHPRGHPGLREWPPNATARIPAGGKQAGQGWRRRERATRWSRAASRRGQRRSEPPRAPEGAGCRHSDSSPWLVSASRPPEP